MLRNSALAMLLAVSTLSLAETLPGVAAQSSDFWEGFDADEPPYEHDWTDIPDFINKTQVSWYFNMSHHFLTGVERGIYMNDSITLDPLCFGERYVTKINEFAAMIKDDIWKNIILELSVIYQVYYMLGDKCSIDKIFNDMYIYCWNEGCYSDEIWSNTENNFLYMTRALIDAAIVW